MYVYLKIVTNYNNTTIYWGGLLIFETMINPNWVKIHESSQPGIFGPTLILVAYVAKSSKSPPITNRIES